jgi:hypothetical protein
VVIEYEPETGALTATDIQTATNKAAVKILFDSPEAECTALLKTAQLEVTQGGTMKGNVSIPAAIFPPTARYGVRIYIRTTKTEKRERQYDNRIIHRHGKGNRRHADRPRSHQAIRA